ncbi:MAG: Smr/MutS family protein, partial [Muribaculaceae bacterium]|nr:Smr/MutS family protein [Muribaculaceae bacterium]
PIYANMFEEDEISFLQIKDKAQDLKRSFSNSNKKAPKRKKNAGGSPESNPHKVLAPIEVDLHIYELVDSTAGMDNFAMLQLQLDTVRKTMRSHCRRIGQKIIFIHGKGDGVLRKEVRKLLSKEYASCDLQDASFLKYGFGATEVTVRQS